MKRTKAWTEVNQLVQGIMARGGEPGKIADVALDEVIKLPMVDCCWVHHVDRRNQRFTLQVERGFTLEMVKELRSAEMERGILSKAAVSGEPLVVSDMASDTRYNFRSFVKAGFHSLCVLFVKVESEVVVIVGVCSRNKGEFDPSIGALFSIVVNQIVMAWKLLDLSRQREEELALLTRLSGIVTSNLDIKQVYSSFVEELSKVVDVDWASMLEIDEDKARFVGLFTRVGSAWQEGEVVLLKGTATEWVAKHKKLLVEPDLSVEKKFWTGEHYLKLGLRSIVYLPLMVRGKIFAGLSIASQRPNAYGERELSLLERVVAQISLPIENARLYQLEREQRKALEREVKALERGVKEKARLMDVVVHELGVPLTPTLSSAQVLADELQQKGTETDIQLAKNVLDGAIALRHRLDDFIDFTKGEMSLLKVFPQPADIAELVDNIALQWLAMFVNRKQRFQLEIEPHLPQVLVDKTRTGQILFNLLSNASKFSPEGTTIVLVTKKRRDKVIIQVRDNGPGIDLERRRKLFDIHRYSDADGDGFAGLGLFVCKSLVELQGGKIWARSKPSEGSTFSFSLPLASKK